ncbi:hypothetical protein PG997_004281 [Apiospora hydei]|uniref:Uncharacterized protein n=1 Tax=Apiospora hydei TaxID=1337664 RepID=A0ABR1X1S0_9PEZI
MAALASEEISMKLDSIHKYHTIHTNLRSTYGMKWEPWEAFRELVQNWRDGIIQSFKLDEETSRSSGRKTQYLGYIRFSGNEKGGRVELVNRNASIQPDHFDLGGTTKQKSKSQAGEHGDGLKVTLLVLMRAPQKHSICFIAGGFRWEPNFDKHNKLVVNLSRLQTYDSTLEERSSKPDLQEGLIPVLASPHNDVKFIIGLGDSVKIQDFNKWTKAALFLQEIEDDGIVSVAEGDLITSKTLRGNIYLKGLLLKASKGRTSSGRASASITGKYLRFGYNFAHGDTNRDRQSLIGASDEARAIFAIWAKVLQKKPDLVSELSMMLNTRRPDYADVSLAEEFLGAEIVDKLKTYLFSAPFEKRWYYTRSEKVENIELTRTIRSLGRTQYCLEEDYWTILASRNLVRTAEKEKCSRFLKQKEEEIPDTPFAKDVHWYLRACLRSCSQTEKARIMCVEGAGLDLTTMWEEEKDLARIHRDDDRPFSPGSGQGPTARLAKEAALNRAEQRLLDCMQFKKRLRISKFGPSHEPKLLVSWEPEAAWKPDRDFLQVEVHQVSKMHPSQGCVASRGMCRYLSHDGEATFSALQEGELYFAIIYNSSDPSSFIVASENTVAMPKATAPPLPVTRKRAYTLGKKLGIVNMITPREWYGGSDGNGHKAVIGIPPEDVPKPPAGEAASAKRSAADNPATKRARLS